MRRVIIAISFLILLGACGGGGWFEMPEAGTPVGPDTIFDESESPPPPDPAAVDDETDKDPVPPPLSPVEVRIDSRINEVLDTPEPEEPLTNLNSSTLWPPNYPQKKTYAYEQKAGKLLVTSDEREADRIWTENAYPRGEIDNLVSMWTIDHRRPDTLFNPTLAAERLNKMPEGHRALFSWQTDNLINQEARDFCHGRDPSSGRLRSFTCLWWGSHGVKRVSNLFSSFFDDFRTAGGTVDLVILDMEEGMSMWSTGPEGYAANWTWREHHPEWKWHQAQWEIMQSDARFSSERILDQLVNLGYDTRSSLAESVYHWGPYANRTSARENYLVWNSLMTERTANYLNEAIYDPIRERFPSIKMSNFDHRYWSREYALPDLYGHAAQKYGNGAIVGTHQSHFLYGELAQITRFGALIPGMVYEHSPYNALKYSVNLMRAMVLSRPDVPIHPWIDWRSSLIPGRHNGVMQRHFRDHDYYQENILHAALAGADNFLYWNDGSTPEDDLLLSRTLKELDQLIGYDVSRQTLITNFTPWNQSTVLTGMQVGDFHIWRLSFDEDNPISVESRTLNNSFDETIVFTTSEGSLTFPNAILYESENPVSSLGYWIIQEESAPLPYLE